MSDESWLLQAIELSRRCPRSYDSFAVGAVLLDRDENFVADGYSLERGERMHAEEVALAKAEEQAADLQGGVMFSSLEPCSVRLSGKRSCADRIVAAGIRRVVYALDEPPVFVRCEGVSLLRENGVEVVQLAELGEQVLQVNSHLFDPA